MPIVQQQGSVLITGDNSQRYLRMVVLKGALSLEVLGLKRRGRSAYSIVKEEFQLTGSKRKVLEKFKALIEAEYPNARSAQ